jgi:hypothetical protein
MSTFLVVNSQSMQCGAHPWHTNAAGDEQS